MRKWIKTGLLLIALLLVGAIIFSFVSYELARGTPDWYRPHALSLEERAQAARRADDKFLSLLGRAADAQAAGRRTQNSSASPAASSGSEPITVSFTDDELNAFFYKWIQLNHWDQKMGQYLSNPQIILHDGQLILAGQVNMSGLLEGTVLSVHFVPTLDQQGQLMVNIDGISAGRLPLPNAVWESQRDKLEELVREKLPALRRQSRIGEGGSANAAAVGVAMSDMLLHVLNGQPTVPVVFLPVNPHEGYPMNLTQLHIEKGSIALSALPLTRQQRGQLREQIKGQK
jgi:hypothetical protein